MATATPISVLAVEKDELIEGLTSGMRAELQTRFSSGPAKTVLVTGASTSAGFDAAKKNDAAAVTRLLAAKADVNWANPEVRRRPQRDGSPCPWHTHTQAGTHTFLGETHTLSARWSVHGRCGR